MIHFKTPRIEREFNELPLRNKRLLILLQMASQYSEFEFRKEITITDLYRTPEENAKIYASSTEPVNRPHTLWEGADLRSSIYKPNEIYKFVNFLNLFTSYGGKRITAFCHTVPGGAPHFHLQTSKEIL